VAAGTEPVQAPAVDPTKDAYIAEVILNPGANLHLRLSPNVNSQSLDLIPAGTKVIISGRGLDTDGRNWLQVTFEGQSGWAFAAPISITFNGQLADITEIPVLQGVDKSTDTDDSEVATEPVVSGDRKGIFIEYEDWHNQLPESLQATSREEARVIIQVAQGTTPIQDCGVYRNSAGQDIARSLNRIDFTLTALRATTEEFIDRQIFEGRPLAGCPDSVEINDPLNGLPPNFSAALPWISGL
jgi:uncharacterized protein YraI